MVFFLPKRQFWAYLATVLVFVVAMLPPGTTAFADPVPPPAPPPGVVTYIPKPTEVPSDPSVQPATDGAIRSSPPLGTKTDVPKPESGTAPNAVAPKAAPAVAWSVTMTASNRTPQANTPFTLTAIANQDVGPTVFFIRIYLGSTRYASCGVGTTCSVTLIGPQAGAVYDFDARIEDYFGIFIQARYYVRIRILYPWTLSLAVSPASPNINQNFTLTAYVNQDVGPTPYWIEIWNSTAPKAICGVGLSCSVTLSSSRPQTLQYRARVSGYYGDNVQAWSNVVTVNVHIPSSYRLVTPAGSFQTQIGSAGTPGVGSNNCGPASVAMAINYLKGQPYVTASEAAYAIRGGSNYQGQLGTDFKAAGTLNFLTSKNLHTNPAVKSFDDMRLEIASGRPVIILVDNNQYRANNPYPQLGSGAWTKSHIIEVTGYDTTYVYINDPLRQAIPPTPIPRDWPVPVATFRLAASSALNGSTYTSEGNWYAMSVYR